MPRKNPARDALIADIKKRQRAAGQKVSRLERSGVVIKKNGLDPRQPIENLSNMSQRQLRAYHKQLNDFTDRKNGYLAGVRGKPISRQRFNELKRLESEFNKRAQVYEKSIGGINVPGSGRTIEARLDALEKAKFDNPLSNRRTFEKYNRKASNINGTEAVEEFIKQMKDKLKPSYLNKRMRTQRDNLEVMLKQSGDDDILDALNKLTNNQLNTLLDYSYFMTAVGGRYAYAKLQNAEDKPSNSDKDWLSSENEDNRKRMDDLIDWAGNLPKRGMTTTRAEYTNTNVGQFAQQFNPRNTNVSAIPTQRGGKRNRRGK